MGPKAAVFSHNGLGDGVNLLALSNHLHLNGWTVDTYQEILGQMSRWFPHLPVLNYPSQDKIPHLLTEYDWLFVVENHTCPFIQKLIEEGKRRAPERVKVLYFYPSKLIVNEPYYADCLTDPSLSLAENIRRLCEKVLHLSKISRGNGLIPPQGVKYRKYLHRIVIHPTSSREARMWPKEKFFQLQESLREKGYEVIFVPGEKYRDEWESYPVQSAYFPTLDGLASFLYESAFLIGSDSGVGHLASALGIPTLTFFHRKTHGLLWAPGFQIGEVVHPPSWIPNVRWFRLRDRYWRKFVSVRKVQKAFARLEGRACSLKG